MKRLAIPCAALLFACGGGKPAPSPPATPGNVAAHAGDGQVTVLWDAVGGARGYRVYSGVGALTAHAAVGSAASWTVVGLTNGTEYQFAVSALGTGGESARSAAVKVTPQATVPLAVGSVTPADGATAVARNAVVVVKFNRPATNVTAGCTGTVLLSDDAFATCAGGSFAEADAGATWTFTPTAPLHANAKYRLRVTTGVKDGNGISLGAQADSAGFTTAAALTAAIAPSGTVPLRPQITVTFNRAVTAASVTSIESGTACSGSVRLSAGGVCVAMTHGLAGNVAIFQPAADLAPSTAYAVTVTAGVLDSDGVPLEAVVTGGFTTVSGVSVTSVDFQHIALVWALPGGATESRVYVRPAGGAYTTYTSFTSPAATATLLLTPGKTWDVKVTTLGAGVPDNNGEVLGVSTAFAGTAAEWLDGQTADGEAGGHFRFTWSDSEFFAAYSDATDSATLNPANGDALWIAFDTGLGTGEARTTTGLNGEIFWPFKADYVVELKNGGAKLRTAASSSWATLTAGTRFTSSISEIRFAKAALANPAKVRIALAAVSTHTGDPQPAYTFDLAPGHGSGNAVPTLGQLASLTALLPTQAFDPAAATTSAAATPVDAPTLVKFTLSKPGASGALQIAGTLSPLSLDLTRSVYQLHAADIGLWDGRFNFGGQTGELFFKFMDDTAAEPIFTPGKDRVYTLSGGADTLPALTWNHAYGAGGSFQIVFACTSGCSGAAELRELPAAGGFATLQAPFTGAATVHFTSRDFVTAPLNFKAWYGVSGPDDYEGTAGVNHILDDDVINTRTLTWTAGDGATF